MSMITPHCKHTNITKINSNFFCVQCGSLQTDTQTIKAPHNAFPAKLDPLQNLQAQWNRVLTVPITQSRTSIIEYMVDWTDKLKLSQNTLFLAVSYFDYYISKKNPDSNQHKLLGACSLLLAAKAIELDERIPFISKLRRYTNLHYATFDFRRCENQLLKELNWELQTTTLFDWVESILSIGALFENDELSQDNVLREKNFNIDDLQAKIDNLIIKKDNIIQQTPQNTTQQISSLGSNKVLDIWDKMESYSKKLALLVLKDGTLLTESPQQLSLGLVAHIRKVLGFKKEMQVQMTQFELYILNQSQWMETTIPKYKFRFRFREI